MSQLKITLIMLPLSVIWGFAMTKLFHARSEWWIYLLIFMAYPLVRLAWIYTLGKP